MARHMLLQVNCAILRVYIQPHWPLLMVATVLLRFISTYCLKCLSPRSMLLSVMVRPILGMLLLTMPLEIIPLHCLMPMAAIASLRYISPYCLRCLSPRSMPLSAMVIHTLGMPLPTMLRAIIPQHCWMPMAATALSPCISPCCLRCLSPIYMTQSAMATPIHGKALPTILQAIIPLHCWIPMAATASSPFTSMYCRISSLPNSMFLSAMARLMFGMVPCMINQGDILPY